MRVVVTGANGFLASGIISQIQNTQHELSFITRRKGLNSIPLNDLSDLPTGGVLVHCAEVADRAWVNKQGDQEVDRALSTLSALLDKGFDHIVYPSSAVLYSENCGQNIKSNDPVKVTDHYSKIKKASEDLVLGAGGTVVRFSNIFGPKMSKNNVISDIIRQMYDEGPVVLREKNSVRDFLWVDDAAELIIKTIEKPRNEIFNCGSGIGTPIEKLFELIIRRLSINKHLEVLNVRRKETNHLVLDISETEKTFGWTPKTSLQAGLNKILTHYEA